MNEQFFVMRTNEVNMFYVLSVYADLFGWHMSSLLIRKILINVKKNRHLTNM